MKSLERGAQGTQCENGIREKIITRLCHALKCVGVYDLRSLDKGKKYQNQKKFIQMVLKNVQIFGCFCCLYKLLFWLCVVQGETKNNFPKQVCAP